MIGYPTSYGDLLEHENDFTSQALEDKVNDYWNEDRKKLFWMGYQHGLMTCSIMAIFLISQSAIAESGISKIPEGTCPVGEEAPAPAQGTPNNPTVGGSTDPVPNSKPTSGSLANVPTGDRGLIGGSVITICTVAVRNGAY